MNKKPLPHWWGKSWRREFGNEFMSILEARGVPSRVALLVLDACLEGVMDLRQIPDNELLWNSNFGRKSLQDFREIFGQPNKPEDMDRPNLFGLDDAP